MAEFEQFYRRGTDFRINRRQRNSWKEKCFWASPSFVRSCLLEFRCMLHFQSERFVFCFRFCSACLGKTMAFVEIKTFITKILHKFDLELVSKKVDYELGIILWVSFCSVLFAWSENQTRQSIVAAVLSVWRVYLCGTETKPNEKLKLSKRKVM